MNGFTTWLVLVGAVILAGITVPYGLLGGSAAALDVFWFWSAFGVAIVVLIVGGVSRWRV
ncbi:hypothetical protein [Marivita sp.]|uniref:hypothetical protein n=1 Tax=Marivita sp. TaxID=2003365 RepID=UPI0025C3CBF0|nr:hypothetical protein [Marivita sp.]